MEHKVSRSPKYLVFMLILFAATFFGFVDDKFRGWDDTHQYQLEAQAWRKGSRPPVPEIIANSTSHVGPTHVPPLVPYSWSLGSVDSDAHATLYRIRIFQALLLFLSFIGLAMAMRRPSLTPDLIAIAVLVFFNEFSRQLVEVPLSEPLAILLLIASYVWPRFSGVGVALEFMVRPPLILLFAPLLWRQKRSPAVIVGAMVTLAAGAVFFKRLLIPSAFKGGGFSAANARAVIGGFGSDSAFQIFNHLLPWRSPAFLLVWGVTLALALALLFFKKRAAWVTWLAFIAYFSVILIPWAQGIRYFFPLILFLILEFKPVLPRKTVVLLPLTLLLIHLSVRQVGSCLELKRHPVPETESAGLVAAKNWLVQGRFEKDSLMMGRFRYCINFFQTSCYGFNFGNPRDAIAEIRERKIHFMVFTSISWQTEEMQFEREFRKALYEKNYPIEKMTHSFDEVNLIDVSRL